MGLADEVSRECLAVRVRKINRAVTNLYDDALRPLGLRVSQMNILVVAERLGTARPGQIGRILDLEASTLSRNLERMRRRGWIEAMEDESDARSQPFRLTAGGRRLLTDAYPAWRLAQEKAAQLLGADAVEAIRGADLGAVEAG